MQEKLQRKCPFCREPIPDTDEKSSKQWMKRIEMNDPVALRQEGANQYDKSEYRRAFEYLTQAAELGDVEAHHRLSLLYHHNGQGVEKDRNKQTYHMEEAAVGGHPRARYNLGSHEWSNGNQEKAVKHFIIAANQGHDLSIKSLTYAFKKGFIEKDDLAAALRAHQAAVDATKSPQREAAEEYYQHVNPC